MPKVSDLDDYLHAEAVQDGEVVTIINTPTLVSENESAFGRPYFELTVQLESGEVKTYTPNKTTLKKLAAKYGDETNGWVNKQIKLSKSKMNVRGEVKSVLFGEGV
jgi:hypothetical protein